MHFPFSREREKVADRPDEGALSAVAVPQISEVLKLGRFVLLKNCRS